VSVSSGGRDIAKKIWRPDEITIVIASGMTVHVISSA